MATNQDQQHGNYTPHGLSELTAQMQFYPASQEETGVMPILSDSGSAVSRAEQLQGILCLEQPPKTVRTTTVPKREAKRDDDDDEEEEEEEEKQKEKIVDVFELPFRDYYILMERAILEDGPVVAFQDTQLMSRRVLTMRPSAYPPRSLDHTQTCDVTDCRLSSNEQLPVLLSTPLADQSQSQSQLLSAALVLGTPEILELVLFHLDIKTRIVSAPRVCKFWLDTLNQSPLVKKASFFQPEKSPSASSEEPPRINPLLLEAFGDAFFDLSNDKARKHSFRRAEYFWKLPWSPQALLKLRAGNGSIRSVEPTCRQRSFTRAGASWRRMLVSQPPPPFLGFTWLNGFPDGTMGGNRIRIDSLNPRNDDAGGVTMGQLYDTVQFLAMQQEKPGLFFRIRWDMVCERSKSGTVDEDDSMLESTNLVAEFWDDAYFNSNYYGPFAMEGTRSTFQCEGSEKPTFTGQGRIEGLDPEASYDVPPIDEVELWEPMTWDPDA